MGTMLSGHILSHMGWEVNLNANENVDVSEFNKLISSWKKVFKWKTTSFVAIKTPDGPKLFIGRIMFDSIKPNDNLHFNFESTHIIAGREITNSTIEDIDFCINNATGGKLVFAKQTFSLHQKSGDFMGITFFPIYHPAVTSGARLPSIIIRGSSKHELLSSQNYRPGEILDWDLKAADQPFDSLDALLLHLGFLAAYQAGDSTTLEVIATSPVAIMDDSRIVNGVAHIKCKVAADVDTQQVKFGYKAIQSDWTITERNSINGGAFEWSTDDSTKTGATNIAIKDASILQGFLSYNGIALHQWWIDDPDKRLNPRHAIHEIFDNELNIIKKFLLTHEGRQNRSFEHGMALLLSILGFSVLHYGKLSNMEDGPDLLAITPRGNIGVVECTTGLLNAKDKLTKLVQRTTLIKEHLVKAGHGHFSVHPAIVTALSRNEIKADLERAGENRIAVICRENIEELLKRVTLPTNPDELFQEAQQLIPSTDQKSLFKESV